MWRTFIKLFIALIILSGLIFHSSVIHADEKRPVPDYDGRQKETVTVGDVLLYVPRVIFYPVYFTTEYLLRKPIGFVFTKAEEHHLPQKIQDTFTFGPENNIVLYPTFFIDLGFRPRVGFNLFWAGFLHKNNRLALRAQTGGKRWISVSLVDRISLPQSNSEIFIGAGINRRPDWIFHGIGPSSLKSNRSHYLAFRKEGGIGYKKKMFREGFLQLSARVRDVTFANGDATGIQTFINNGTFPSPPGFTSGYTIFLQRIDVAMGSRVARPDPNVGGRAEFHFEHANDVDRPGTQHWIKYGGTLVGFVNLYNHDRILSLTLDTQFADILSDSGAVPFTELVQLGGSGPMPGFLKGRLVDESAVALTLSYRWPIWAFLDGYVHYAVGNVFNKHLKSFKFGLLRQSVGVGMQVPDKSSGGGFSLLVAWGSNTFNSGGSFNEFRFLIGTSRAL